MRINKSVSTGLLILLGAFFVSAMGCGGGPTADAVIADSNKDNMQRVINLYERFQMKNQWKGPKDDAEFKEFINGLDNKTLERMGIAPGERESVLISDRDDSPFKIRFGVKGSARGSNEALVFESVGVNGVRVVGFSTRLTEEVSDDARFDGLFDGSQKPASNKSENAIPGVTGR